MRQRRVTAMLTVGCAGLLVGAGFVAFRDSAQEPCYQATMGTPAPDPKPTADAAARTFTVQHGWGDEFVDDLTSYTQMSTASAVEFTTGSSPAAEFRTVETAEGWIVNGVALTCPM